VTVVSARRTQAAYDVLPVGADDDLYEIADKIVAALTEEVAQEIERGEWDDGFRRVIRQTMEQTEPSRSSSGTTCRAGTSSPRAP
jgi:hypothetical protein